MRRSGIGLTVISVCLSTGFIRAEQPQMTITSAMVMATTHRNPRQSSLRGSSSGPPARASRLPRFLWAAREEYFSR